MTDCWIWSLWWNKKGLFLNGHVGTTVWMQHMDTKKEMEKKAKWELLDTAKFCSEQILETTSNKTAAVGPLTFYLTNYPNTTNKTCWSLLEKERTNFKVTFTYGLLHMKTLVLGFLRGLGCTYVGCDLEGPAGAIDDRVRGKERIRELRSTGGIRLCLWG